MGESWLLLAQPQKNTDVYGAAKFTKNKNDQWSHAWSFHVHLCRSLFEDAT